jgi:hypothetical protein
MHATYTPILLGFCLFIPPKQNNVTYGFETLQISENYNKNVQKNRSALFCAISKFYISKFPNKFLKKNYLVYGKFQKKINILSHMCKWIASLYILCRMVWELQKRKDVWDGEKETTQILIHVRKAWIGVCRWVPTLKNQSLSYGKMGIFFSKKDAFITQ